MTDLRSRRGPPLRLSSRNAMRNCIVERDKLDIVASNAGGLFDQTAEDYLAAGYGAALDDLKALCRLPSISTDAAYGDGIRAAAQFAAGALGRSSLPTVEIVETGGHPVAFAEGPNLPS